MEVSELYNLIKTLVSEKYTGYIGGKCIDTLAAV
jgi:hypothetical protein